MVVNLIRVLYHSSHHREQFPNEQDHVGYLRLVSVGEIEFDKFDDFAVQLASQIHVVLHHQRLHLQQLHVVDVLVLVHV